MFNVKRLSTYLDAASLQDGMVESFGGLLNFSSCMLEEATAFYYFSQKDHGKGNPI